MHKHTTITEENTMYELSSSNLDVVAAEVAYRHRVSNAADYRELTRGHRWPRRHRKSSEHAERSA